MRLSKITNFLKEITSLKARCIFIGLAQLSLLILRVYEITWHYIKLQEPIGIHIHEFDYKIASGLIQLATIFCLFYGIISDKASFILPWLCVTTPALAIASVYVVLGLFMQMKEDGNQILINCIVLGVVWCAWICLFNYFKQRRTKSCGNNYASVPS